MAPLEDDAQLLALLRAGDEAAFMRLVNAYHRAMCRLAAALLGDAASAEEVTQETWLVVIDTLHQFEARASLKTWIFAILVRKARKRATREARALRWAEEAIALEQSAEHERFNARGHWSAPPRVWRLDPEAQLQHKQLLALVRRSLDTLSPLQRAVVTLRDIEGFDGPQTCQILELTPEHQRVLLHRGRASIRQALEQHHQAAREVTS